MKIKNNNKKMVVKRFKIIEGHLRKITEMVEDGAYCVDILQQTIAVKNAIKSAESVLLDNHLHSCVIRDVKKGKNKAVNELLVLFKKINN